MASPLSILKTVLNLKHNKMHVISLEEKVVPVHRNREIYEQTRIYVHARPHKKIQMHCPYCMKKCPGYDMKHETESTWRTPNLNGVPVFICYRPQRIECPEHGVLTEFIPWADGDSRFTEDFNNEVAWMVCQMSKTAISLFEDIDWRTVGNCIKAAHGRIEPDVTVRLHGLRRICVDETSYRKGFSYITVVYDMELNRVVWIHEGNGLEVFKLFCEALTPEEREKIEIVAGDGAKWIDTCTKLYFPNATRCIDFFHVAEWANEALDKVRITTASKASNEYERRKKEFREAEDKAAKAAQAAEEQRRAAEAELNSMPKLGRPSSRKLELLAFLASFQETGMIPVTEEQLRTAEAELAALPKHGRPSRRKKELLAFLADPENNTLPDHRDPKRKGRGRPRKDELSPEHQAVLDQLADKAKSIKGAKHALGHNPENCTECQTDKIKLIENNYPDLYRAYQLKEALRLILHMKDDTQAANELNQWISDAAASGLKPMEELAAKIERHKENILNSIRCQANSAKSEAVNTTIKVLIKMARGFRNIGNLVALIYLKCSDLVIPLNNRPQMTAEQAASARNKANEQRSRRRMATIMA